MTLRAQRIMVVGATGQIGQAIVAQLGDREAVYSAGPEGADLYLDLFDPDSIDAALAEAGALDAIICAAGPGAIAPLGDMVGPADPGPVLAPSFSGKLLGQIRLALAGGGMLRDGGSITLITGVTAVRPVPMFAALAAANAGVEGFVRAAALEMPRNLRINAVSPGVLAGSPDAVLRMFAGHAPVMIDAVAAAFVASVDGDRTGQVFNIN